MPAEDIVLGDGVFSIGATDIALTRGGGKFVVERKYKQIEADGDRGPVKGRIRVESSVAKLTVNTLEILPANLPKMYPATQIANVTGPPEKDTFTAATDVTDADYSTVKFTGVTKGGRSVIITLDNAINMENLDWSLVDKDEVVPSLTYTGAYLENSRKTEPWKVEFIDAV